MTECCREQRKDCGHILKNGFSDSPHIFSLVLETIKYFPISEGITCIKL